METAVLSPTRDVYSAITTKIIAAVEAGAGDFVMPWHRSLVGIGRPRNATTTANYRGVNIVALWAEAMLSGFASGYWASYKQWQTAGAQVRKGERGAVIVFYRELDQPALPLDGTSGDEAGRRFVARASYVFNAEQVDGWSPPEQPPASSIEPCDAAEELVRRSRATVRDGHTSAYYDYQVDRICLPQPEWFVGSPTSTPTESYYSTLLHELVHWTGATHRLNRPFDRFGTEVYAREELVAELGAAFLCGDLAIANEPRPDHAAYVASWLSILREDSRAIFRAARLSEQAVEYLQRLNSDA